MKHSTLAFASLAGCSSVLLGSIGCGNLPKDDNLPPVVGNIFVSVGFGAGSSGGGRCEGSGAIRLISNGVAIKRNEYSFSGTSSTTSPSCITNLNFPSLPGGTYTVLDETSGTSCPAPVSVGNATQVKMRTDTRVCGF